MEGPRTRYIVGLVYTRPLYSQIRSSRIYTSSRRHPGQRLLQLHPSRQSILILQDTLRGTTADVYNPSTSLPGPPNPPITSNLTPVSPTNTEFRFTKLQVRTVAACRPLELA